jgi:hypothetical protein
MMLVSQMLNVVVDVGGGGGGGACSFLHFLYYLCFLCFLRFLHFLYFLYFPCLFLYCLVDYFPDYFVHSYHH